MADAQTQYTHTSPEGVVYVAESREEAISKCPILGNLSLELAGIMLDLASVGEQVMAEEAAQREATLNHTETVDSKNIDNKSKSKKTPEAVDTEVRNQGLTQSEEDIERGYDNLLREKAFATENTLVALIDPSIADIVTKDMPPKIAQVDEAIIFEMIRVPFLPPEEITPASPSGNNEPITVRYVGSLETPQLGNDQSERTQVMGNQPIAPEVLAAPETINAVADTEISDSPVLDDFIEDHYATDPNLASSYVEPVDWTVERTHDPQQMYEDFTQALEIFAGLPVNPTIEAVNESEAETVQENNEREMPIGRPVIVLQVAEHLAVLDAEKQESVALIIKDTVTAIDSLKVLESEDASPEAIEAAALKLEAVCITLLEALGIEYDEEIVEQFVQIMRDPDFKAPQNGADVMVDLEYVGTHEAKHHIPKPGTGLAKAEDLVQQMLGAFALIYATIAQKLSATQVI